MGNRRTRAYDNYYCETCEAYCRGCERNTRKCFTRITDAFLRSSEKRMGGILLPVGDFSFKTTTKNGAG